MTEIAARRLPNGLHVAAEAVPGARSGAFALLVPCGAAADPSGLSGAAAILKDWMLRGAGDRDARALSEAMDSLGLDRGVSAGTEAVVFSGALLARDLPRALALAADVLRRPRLPDEEFEACRALALQAIDSLNDDPASLCMVETARRFLPPPLHRPYCGEAGEIRAASAAAVRDSARARLGPAGACLGIAGGIDPAAAIRTAEDLLGGWAGGAGPVEVDPAAAGSGPARDDVERPGSQIQIGVAYRSVPADSPDADLARLGASVLSGGMGSRLFVEVREKRGLVYSVRASVRAYRGLGAVFAYAGTTPPRAAETLEVLLAELRRLHDGSGVTAEEFDRAKVKARSSLVMDGESPRARAAALANDLFLRGRPRPLDEALEAYARSTRDDLQRHLAACAPEAFTVLTLGPRREGA